MDNEGITRVQAECNRGMAALKEFAFGSIEASTRAGVSLRWLTCVYRTNTIHRHIEPLRINGDCELPLPEISEVIRAIEVLCNTPGQPMAIAFFGLGGAQTNRGDDVHQSAFVCLADVFGNRAEYLRHWSPDGPVGDWRDVTEPGTNYGPFLSAAMTSARLTGTWTAVSSGVCTQFGAPVDPLLDPSDKE